MIKKFLVYIKFIFIYDLLQNYWRGLKRKKEK